MRLYWARPGRGLEHRWRYWEGARARGWEHRRRFEGWVSAVKWWGWLRCWLVGWLMGWLADYLTGWLVGLICWFDGLMDWLGLIGRLVDYLIVGD